MGRSSALYILYKDIDIKGWAPRQHRERQESPPLIPSTKNCFRKTHKKATLLLQCLLLAWHQGRSSLQSETTSWHYWSTAGRVSSSCHWQQLQALRCDGKTNFTLPAFKRRFDDAVGAEKNIFCFINRANIPWLTFVFIWDLRSLSDPVWNVPNEAVCNWLPL